MSWLSYELSGGVTVGVNWTILDGTQVSRTCTVIESEITENSGKGYRKYESR